MREKTKKSKKKSWCVVCYNYLFLCPPGFLLVSSHVPVLLLAVRTPQVARDALWIAKSSQGSHGFDVSSRDQSESVSKSVASTALAPAAPGEFAADFGHLIATPRGGEAVSAEYMTLQGSFASNALLSADAGAGAGVAGGPSYPVIVEYARLPLHSRSLATLNGEEEAQQDSSNLAYLAALARHYDAFRQRVIALQQLDDVNSSGSSDDVSSSGRPHRVLVLDVAPLSEAEVERGRSGSESVEGERVSSIDTLEALRSVRTLFQGEEKEKMEWKGSAAAAFQGLFLLSLPDNESFPPGVWLEGKSAAFAQSGVRTAIRRRVQRG
jgi:hypothetical protein